MGALLDLLRHHRDALAALESYGNGGGNRAIAARNALEMAKMQIPTAVDLFHAEAVALDDAGAETRATELRIEADLLEDFLAGRPDPEPVAPRRRKRRA